MHAFLVLVGDTHPWRLGSSMDYGLKGEIGLVRALIPYTWIRACSTDAHTRRTRRLNIARDGAARTVSRALHSPRDHSRAHSQGQTVQNDTSHEPTPKREVERADSHNRLYGLANGFRRCMPMSNRRLKRSQPIVLSHSEKAKA